MASNLRASTLTDVYFLNTTTRPGVVLMPSTIQNIGRFLTFKDTGGNFQRSTITFSTIQGAQTFEDNTILQTYNDQFGAYTFVANSNKWLLVGGSRMNNAVISTVTTSTLNVRHLSTAQIFTSTITLPNSNNIFSRNNVLYYGSTFANGANAWGGARTALSQFIPVPATYSFVTSLRLSGSNLGTVNIQGSYTVHTFNAIAGGIYDFTVTVAGTMEIIVVGQGGTGGQGGTFGGLNRGGGGGGGGGVLNLTGTLITLPVGQYRIFNTTTAGQPTFFSSLTLASSIRFVANQGQDGVTGVGSTGDGGLAGSGGFSQGFGASGTPGTAGGGGAGTAGAGTNGSVARNLLDGGNGGIPVVILDYSTGTNTNAGGGGGGGIGAFGGFQGFQGIGGFGSFGGGTGGNGGTQGGGGSAGSAPGGGGGGGGGNSTGNTNGGAGGAGRIQIRYQTFTSNL